MDSIDHAWLLGAIYANTFFYEQVCEHFLTFVMEDIDMGARRVQNSRLVGCAASMDG
jgi:hypothetical protein